MNFRKWIAAGLAACVLAFSAPVFGKDSIEPVKDNKSAVTYSVSAGAEVASRNMSRGYTFSPGVISKANVAVETSNGLSLVYNNLSDLEGLQGIEHDIVYGYSHSLGENFKLNAGFGFYNYPNSSLDNSYEVFGSVTGFHKGFNASLMAAHDFGVGDGNYGELGLGYGTDLSKRLGVNANATAGYNHYYFGETNTGFSHLNLSLGFPIKALEDRLTLTPHVDYNQALMDSPSFVDRFYGGIRLNLQ